MNQTFSDAGQDLFALASNNKKLGGTFVDIGCAYGIDKSNTYLLEKFYGWTGVRLDIDIQYLIESARSRTSPFIRTDAITVDYIQLFKQYNLPLVIDYLSLDIDPPDATLEVLKALPFDEYTFRAITFEHDSYWYGDSVRNEAREIFEAAGYTLKKADVTFDGKQAFEDWYVS